MAECPGLKGPDDIAAWGAVVAVSLREFTGT